MPEAESDYTGDGSRCQFGEDHIWALRPESDTSVCMICGDES